MATNTIIFDSTFVRGYRVNNEPAWDEPLPGASLCAWVPLWTTMPWAPAKYVPKASDFLRVIDAVLAKRGFPTGKDVFRVYPPYNSQINFGPKTTPHSFQLDWEAPWLSNLDPSYYAGIMSAIQQKHPGIRLLTFVPTPLQGFDDGPLKREVWNPDQTTIAKATAFAQRNKAWIDQLWGLVLTCNFGAPSNDRIAIWQCYNMIKLSRLIYPNRRVVVQLYAQREQSWYPPGGVISDQTISMLSGVVKSAHPDGVIIWGLRALNLKLLAAFGITTRTPVVAPTLIVPTRTTAPTFTPIKVGQ